MILLPFIIESSRCKNHFDGIIFVLLLHFLYLVFVGRHAGNVVNNSSSIAIFGKKIAELYFFVMFWQEISTHKTCVGTVTFKI